VFPHACREGHGTYAAPATARLRVTINTPELGTRELVLTKNIGQIPIMVRSKHCHLSNMSPAELVKHHEEQNEAGGYFIINGNEKLVRMLTVSRRNDVCCASTTLFDKPRCLLAYLLHHLLTISSFLCRSMAFFAHPLIVLEVLTRLMRP
jgi:DNA-directed RNA polymerase beta subunit